MKTIKEIIKTRDWAKGRFSKHEFQVYGYYLAESLGDMRHKSLYIKLAKEEPRERLEEALAFVKSSRPRNRGKLFMWKLKELKSQKSKVKSQSHNSKFKTYLVLSFAF